MLQCKASIMIRARALLTTFALCTAVTAAEAGHDRVIDKHQPWETQAGDYCGRNPMSMWSFTSQELSINRCVSNFDTGAVRFEPHYGRTVAQWPIRGEVTHKIIGYCSCVVRD